MLKVEVGGLLGLIHLALVIWAVVSITGSTAGTGSKVFWIVLILIFPIVGFILWFLFGPRAVRRY